MKYFLFTIFLCLLLTGCAQKQVQTEHFSRSEEHTSELQSR